MVVRGYNDASVDALARLTFDHPWQVRFIELMPLGDMAAFSTRHFVSEDEMRTRIAAEFVIVPRQSW